MEPVLNVGDQQHPVAEFVSFTLCCGMDHFAVCFGFARFICCFLLLLLGEVVLFLISPGTHNGIPFSVNFPWA